MHNFITPVSMQVTKEQYDKDLKESLEKLGYNLKHVDYDSKDSLILCTNESGHRNNNVINMPSFYKEDYDRYFIDHYNPELFLALAAMTDEKNGIAGQYWKFIGDAYQFFTKNKHKANHSINEWSAFKSDKGKDDGFGVYNHEFFIKATKEELINHFSKKETIMSKIDRTISIKCANQKEFDIVKQWLTDKQEAISLGCTTSFSKQCLVIYYNADCNVWNSGHKNNSYDNIKTPQELGIINNIVNKSLNKPNMQTLTRKQLVKLHNSFNCEQFRGEINSVLKTNVISLDDTLFVISDLQIKMLVKDGTGAQKAAVKALGILLEEDKSVDLRYVEYFDKNAITNDNNHLRLNLEFNWKLEGNLLTPTKK